jgi:uncharacterized membrane protein YdjX (TVP38/TMEM64 family)
MIELLIALLGFGVAFTFWSNFCDSSLESCLNSVGGVSPGYFILLSVLRPFVVTPVSVFAYMAGHAFGPFFGAFLTCIGTTLSAMVVFGFGKIIGKKLVNPWLHGNLPQTLKFIRSQDWKIMFALRLIPFVPFDLLSLAFGCVDFRFKYFVIATFLGSIPEAYMLANFGSSESSLMFSTISAITIVGVFFAIPVFAYELISRKRGTSMWVRLQAMWQELVYEIKRNNSIVKRNSLSGKKIPVLLLYGFFSSRRALTIIERQLAAKGYEVLSFNLGGLLGVFFTKGITDTAEFIDYKLKRQFARHQFKQVSIIAHSKGGLVALWWMLKLGGDKYCKKIITMGTPYNGTNLTWIALVTPLGFMWKDMWQMRPHSALLKELHHCEIPKDVEIHCLYSHKDAVASGDSGCFKPASPSKNVFPVPMHHVSHFEFLYRRTVGDTLAKILGPPVTIDEQESSPDQNLPMVANSGNNT